MTVSRYRPGRFLPLVCLIALAAVARADGPSRQAGKVDFNRDVRPILSEARFACHGPDKAKRKADMRLDVYDDSLKDNQILVPNKADASELYKRLITDNTEERMPPAKHGKKLTAEQIATIRKW